VVFVYPARFPTSARTPHFTTTIVKAIEPIPVARFAADVARRCTVGRAARRAGTAARARGGTISCPGVPAARSSSRGRRPTGGARAGEWRLLDHPP